MPGVRFDHIAIALPRIADAVPYLAGALGGVPVFGATSKSFRFGQWRFANRGRIEVLEPLTADSFLHRFLAREGGGIHHVTFKVPDLRAACARAEAAGYDVVGYDDSHPHWKEAFLHPKQALGIVVQMAESSGGGDEPARAWEPPARVDDPPPPVALVGLRMRATSRERADAQWVAVLGGAAEERGDGLVVYRWGASPLRIAVEIEPTADEGPVIIEYASDRAVAPTLDPARLHRLFAPAY